MDFIQNRTNLEEQIPTLEGEALGIYKDDFESLESTISKGGNSFIALIGDPGTGKSTFFHNFLVYRENVLKKDFLKFKFDVWEVPGRMYLWDAFVLEFARNINEKLYKSTKEKVDGEIKEGIEKGISAFQGFSILGIGANFDFKTLMQNTPAKRLSDYQDIFVKEVLKEVKQKTIFITLEDIDRAGQEGLYFLETLRKFIDKNKNELSKLGINIVVFVPLLKSEYEKQDKKYRFDKVCRPVLDFSSFNVNSYLVIKQFLQKTFQESHNQKQEELLQYSESIQKVAFVMRNVSMRDIKQYITQVEILIRDKKFIELGEQINISAIMFLLWIRDQDVLDILINIGHNGQLQRYTIKIKDRVLWYDACVILGDSDMNYWLTSEHEGYQYDTNLIERRIAMYGQYLHYEAYTESGHRESSIGHVQWQNSVLKAHVLQSPEGNNISSKQYRTTIKKPYLDILEQGKIYKQSMQKAEQSIQEKRVSW